jgi:hypothetical protein
LGQDRPFVRQLDALLQRDIRFLYKEHLTQLRNEGLIQ